MVCTTCTWICASYPIATNDSRIVVYQRTIFLDFETLKMYLRSTMLQKRLNHIAIMYIYAEMVGKHTFIIKQIHW